MARSPGRLRAAVAGLALAVASSVSASVLSPAPAEAIATSSPSASGTYLFDPAHDGNAGWASLTAPLGPSWLNDSWWGVDYAVVGGGGVYTTVCEGVSPGCLWTWLLGFDEGTGQLLFPPHNLGSSSQHGAKVAYAGGRLFVMTATCLLSAMDAQTLAVIWQLQVGSGDCQDFAPVPANGDVYLHGPYPGLLSIRQSDGTVLWSTTAYGGAGVPMAPAVTSTDVDIDIGNGTVADYAVSDGHLVWQHAGASSGSGDGATPAVYGGRVYGWNDGAHSGNLYALDASTGALLQTLSTNAQPAFDGSTGFVLHSPDSTQLTCVKGCDLEARDLGSGNLLWSFQGDGMLAGPPLVSGGLVYVASQHGVVYGLDEASGALRWSFDTVDPPGWDVPHLAQSATLSAVDAGRLIVMGAVGTWSFVPVSAGTVEPVQLGVNGMPAACYDGGALAASGYECDWTYAAPAGDQLLHAYWQRVEPDGVSLTVRNAAGKVVGSAASAGEDMALRILGLPAGTYTAAVQANGSSAINTDYHVRIDLSEPASGPIALSASPHVGPFGDSSVGQTSAPIALTVLNDGPTAAPVDPLTIAGANPGDFVISDDNCSGTTLPSMATCTVEVSARPQESGSLSADVLVGSGGRTMSDMVMSTNASGSPSPPPPGGSPSPPLPPGGSPPPAGGSGAVGYWLVASDGGVFPFGGAVGYGSTGGEHLNRPVVGLAPTHDARGYWLVAADGGIFPFGDAAGYGSTGGEHLNRPVVGMAPTPDGGGYWLVAADGGIFPFGDAAGYGSAGGERLNQPVAGMAATPSGHGYWLVAADGGIFPFGDAAGYGSTGGQHLNQPVAGMAATPSGHGYWLVAADGGIFPFGDAVGYGSTGGQHLNQPVVGMAATPSGHGYWLVAADGGIFPFGDAVGYGSTGGEHLNRPVVGMAAS